jgi:hypothetical protein
MTLPLLPSQRSGPAVSLDHASLAAGLMGTHVKLPSLYMLACLLARDYHHELGDLTAVHPLFELRHNLFDVRLDLVVSRDCSG